MKSEGCVGVCASACTRMWVGVSLLGVWGPLVFVPLTGRSGIYVFTETGAPENFGVLDQLQGPFIVSPRGRIVVSGTVSIRWCSGTSVARSPPRARVRQRRKLQKHEKGLFVGWKGEMKTGTGDVLRPQQDRGQNRLFCEAIDQNPHADPAAQWRNTGNLYCASPSASFNHQALLL